MTSAQAILSQTTNPNFDLINVFGGYRNKTDITHIPEEIDTKAGQDALVGYLVTGSQNVIMNDADRVATRLGYTLDGAATTSPNVQDEIVSSYDWTNHEGIENHLRSHKSVLEWRYQDVAGNVSYLPLVNSVLSPSFDPSITKWNFAEYWNTTELIDELLMVNGDSSVYRWSGAQGTIAAGTNSALSVVTNYSTHPTVITVVGNQNLTSFSGAWTTAGNSVISGNVNGQIVGFILCPNQPATGDTLTLTINGNNLVITFWNLLTDGPLYYYQAVTVGKTTTYVRTQRVGGNDRVLTGANYTSYPNGTPTSDNVNTTVANLLDYLQNPSYTSFDTFLPAIGAEQTYLSYMGFNTAPVFSGSTTTAGNVVSAAAGILTFAMVNNPANGDTATINFNGETIVTRFVNALSQAGDVIIGVDAATTLSNWTAGLKAPGTTTSTFQAYSATDQLVLGCFSYSDSTGITLQGSSTWAELGFYTSTSGRAVIANGQVFTYTGGETTLTITGVSGSPGSAGFTAGMPVVQATLNVPNSSITGIPSDFGQDTIGVLNNYIWYGSSTSRTIYMSKQNNFTDVSNSSPRLPGEGATFYLDATPNGFGVLEKVSANQSQSDAMLVTAGTDYWYQFVFTLSQDLAKETVVVRRLETSAQSASPNQGAIAKVVKNLVAISQVPTLDYVANLEKAAGPKNLPISDSIKNDFTRFDFTDVHALYFQSNLYIALPRESVVLIYNFARGYWEAPQILPIQRLAIIGGKLYGHSNQVNETYQLFSGTSDSGNPINAIAAFSYHVYSSRFTKKNFTEFYAEGYISPNSVLATNILYDFGGAERIQTKNIRGDGDYSAYGVAKSLKGKTIFNPAIDPDLGKNQIGGEPIGTTEPPTSTLPKFRVILTFQKVDFWEAQIVFQSNDIDQQWELIAFGPAIIPSGADNNEIKV